MIYEFDFSIKELEEMSFYEWCMKSNNQKWLERFVDYNVYDKIALDGKPKKILCKNKKHTSYIQIGEIILNGARFVDTCPMCKFSLSENYPMAVSLWSLKNKTSPYEYNYVTNKKFWWKCTNKKHVDFLMGIREMINSGFSCPRCLEKTISILHEKVIKYLTEKNVNFLMENHCTLKITNPKTKMPLRYDFQLPDQKVIIEVMGQQHYDFIPYFHKTEDMFLESKERDLLKKEFAIKMGYSYIELPYTMEKNDDVWQNEINIFLKK